MRRLSTLRQRFSDEQGGMAVLIGVLFLGVFMLFAALVIDSGSMFQERHELQNAADASALAIAYQCARGDCDSPTPRATLAADLANANAKDGLTDVLDVDIDEDAGEVRVDTGSDLDEDDNPTFLQQLPALFDSFDPVRVVASATVGYGGSPSQLNTFPLALSGCEFDHYMTESEGLDTGIEVEIRIQGSSGPPIPDCEAPAGGAVLEEGEFLEGGFRWLDTDSDCRVTATVDGWVGSDGGTSLPHPNCSSTLPPLINQGAVPLPIFDNACKGGDPNYPTCSSVGLSTPKGYHIFDFVGFRLTGIRSPSITNTPTGYNCEPGVQFCIRGYFESVVVEGPPGGPGLGGVSTVRLVN